MFYFDWGGGEGVVEIQRTPIVHLKFPEPETQKFTQTKIDAFDYADHFRLRLVKGKVKQTLRSQIAISAKHFASIYEHWSPLIRNYASLTYVCIFMTFNRTAARRWAKGHLIHESREIKYLTQSWNF